jgi:hypothetical protein
MTLITIIRPKAPLVVATGIQDSLGRLAQELPANRLVSSVVGRVDQVAVADGELRLVDVDVADRRLAVSYAAEEGEGC